MCFATTSVRMGLGATLYMAASWTRDVPRFFFLGWRFVHGLLVVPDVRLQPMHDKASETGISNMFITVACTLTPSARICAFLSARFRHGSCCDSGCFCWNTITLHAQADFGCGLVYRTAAVPLLNFCRRRRFPAGLSVRHALICHPLLCRVGLVRVEHL